jgi:hypothetical protein
MKVTTVEEIEQSRVLAMYGGERQRWHEERDIVNLMRPDRRGGKLGKRPVGGTFNQRLLQCSPGSSRFYGLDFVKAVYADTTGQEPEIF